MLAGSDILPEATTLPALLGDNVISLDRLHLASPSSLNTPAVDKILNVTLIRVIIAWDNLFHEVIHHLGENIGTSFRQRNCSFPAIPITGRITSATFEFQLPVSPAPLLVTITPPDSIHTAAPEALPLVLQWMRLQGFLVNPANQNAPDDQQSMALP